jgi:hypothetical protein
MWMVRLSMISQRPSPTSQGREFKDRPEQATSGQIRREFPDSGVLKPRPARYVMFFGWDRPRQTRRWLEPARFKLKESKILNRVSTEVGNIPKAKYSMKTTHVALDAV